jgi:hypothetical protein
MKENQGAPNRTTTHPDPSVPPTQNVHSSVESSKNSNGILSTAMTSTSTSTSTTPTTPTTATKTMKSSSSSLSPYSLATQMLVNATTTNDIDNNHSSNSNINININTTTNGDNYYYDYYEPRPEEQYEHQPQPHPPPSQLIQRHHPNSVGSGVVGSSRTDLVGSVGGAVAHGSSSYNDDDHNNNNNSKNNNNNNHSNDHENSDGRMDESFYEEEQDRVLALIQAKCYFEDTMKISDKDDWVRENENEVLQQQQRELEHHQQAQRKSSSSSSSSLSSPYFVQYPCTIKPTLPGPSSVGLGSVTFKISNSTAINNNNSNNNNNNNNNSSSSSIVVVPAPEEPQMPPRKANRKFVSRHPNTETELCWGVVVGVDGVGSGGSDRMPNTTDTKNDNDDTNTIEPATWSKNNNDGNFLDESNIDNHNIRQQQQDSDHDHDPNTTSDRNSSSSSSTIQQQNQQQQQDDNNNDNDRRILTICLGCRSYLRGHTLSTLIQCNYCLTVSPIVPITVLTGTETGP